MLYRYIKVIGGYYLMHKKNESFNSYNKNSSARMGKKLILLSRYAFADIWTLIGSDIIY